MLPTITGKRPESGLDYLITLVANDLVTYLKKSVSQKEIQKNEIKNIHPK